MKSIIYYDKNYGYENLHKDLIIDTWKTGYEDQSVFDFDPTYLEWIMDENCINYVKLNEDKKAIGITAALKRKIR